MSSSTSDPDFQLGAWEKVKMRRTYSAPKGTHSPTESYTGKDRGCFRKPNNPITGEEWRAICQLDQERTANRNAHDKAHGNILCYTLRLEGNRAHLVTWVLHCFHIGHRQMKIAPVVWLVGFHLCTKLINGQLTSTFSIRHSQYHTWHTRYHLDKGVVFWPGITTVSCLFPVTQKKAEMAPEMAEPGAPDSWGPLRHHSSSTV